MTQQQANGDTDQSPASAEPFVGGRIDWTQSATRLEAFIRGLASARQLSREHRNGGGPIATATIGRMVIGIAQSRAGGTMSSYPPGTITRCDEQVWVQTGRGHLAIERVVVEGREQDAAGYFVAHGYTPGDTFDTSSRWPPHPPTNREFSHAA
jgi:methionyl-tRNA formyltransferase